MKKNISKIKNASKFTSGSAQSVDFGITSQVFSINSIKKHIAQYLNVSLLHLRRRKNPMPKLTAGPAPSQWRYEI